MSIGRGKHQFEKLINYLQNICDIVEMRIKDKGLTENREISIGDLGQRCYIHPEQYFPDGEWQEVEQLTNRILSVISNARRTKE